MSATQTTARLDARWRLAGPQDDATIVELCAALHREDPGPLPVPRAYVQRTLRMLRDEPWRGRAVVLQADDIVGYALLISFWSNELGGEVCTVDELYITEQARHQGFGTSLFECIVTGQLWRPIPVALELETTPANGRARSLYERCGFTGKNLSMRRLVAAPPLAET
jgi:GNAT superfamily N-acetyltransferase